MPISARTGAYVAAYVDGDANSAPTERYFAIPTGAPPPVDPQEPETPASTGAGSSLNGPVLPVSGTVVYINGVAFSAQSAGPAPASDVAATLSGDTSATLSWTGSSSDPATGYEVSRDGVDSLGAGAYIEVVGAAIRTFTFTRLVPGSTYNLSVVAIYGTRRAAAVVRPVTIPASAVFTLGTTKPVTANTGVPSGTTLTTMTAGNVPAGCELVGDSLRVTGAGTVLDSWDIPFQVDVRAANVIIRKSIVRGRNTWNTDSACVLATNAAVSNLLVEQTRIVPQAPSYWVNGIMGHDYTARRCDVSGVVDGFSIYNTNAPASVNLLPNSSFEQGITGVTGVGATVSWSTEQVNSGTRSLKVTPAGTGTGEGAALADLSVQPSTAYAFSAYVYQALGARHRLQLVWKNGAGATTTVSQSGSQTGAAASAAWRRFTYLATSPADAVSVGLRVTTTTDIQTAPFHVDDAQLEAGSAATAYVAAATAIGVTLEGNYVHDLAYFTPDPNHSDNQTHNDGIQIQGGTGAVIRGNNIVATYGTAGSHQPTTSGTTPAGQNGPDLACLMIGDAVAATGGHTITENWFAGGYVPVNALDATLGTSNLGTFHRNRFDGLPGAGLNPPSTVHKLASVVWDLGSGADVNVFTGPSPTAGTAITVRTG